MDYAIKIENVSKSYRLGGSKAPDNFREVLANVFKGNQNKENDRDFFALKDINISLEHGKVLGLIGSNGAGKSTLLKIVSGITKPTSGSVSFKGRVGTLLEVGTGFHPELTGRENIFLNGAILGMKRHEISRKFDEIVDFAGIEKFLDTPVKRYSSGMYVRLAFSVAAHLEPEILIVDEVLAVGDAEFQKKCLIKMKEISGSSRTVIFVSHNQAAIESLCDECALLDRGQVSFVGDTHLALQRYRATKNSNTFDNKVVQRKVISEIKVENIIVKSQDGDINGSVRMGGDAIFKLEIVSPSPCENVEVSLGINTLYQEERMLLSNKLTGEKISLKKGINSVSVVVPEWQLGPGTYGVNVHIASHGLVKEWIINAVEFDVEANDFFGTGALPPDAYRKFLCNHQWIL
ncbi:polysaccharide ABC transporter ATP-binding protein [Rhodobacteraceae bacterium nBUS_22]|jgi:lipopolysaccharide transport system ATP-binding protein